jgi:hypothetical protein
MKISEQRLLLGLNVVIWVAILLIGQSWFALFGFLVLWLSGCWYGARTTGWSRLAQAYSTRASFPSSQSSCRFFQSVRFNRWMQYRGIVNVCANEEGVRFSAFLPFRFGHPSFFVPWDEIVGEEETHTTFEYTDPRRVLVIGRDHLTYRGIKLGFSKAPSVIFEIRTELAEILEKASGGVWGYQRA